MNRAEFGDWGANLTERDFWRAVVALGLGSADSLGYFPWQVPLDRAPAAECLTRFHQLESLRLIVPADFSNRQDFLDAGVASLYYEADWKPEPFVWNWPVRFGFLTDPASTAMYNDLRGAREGNETLARLTRANSAAAGGEFELLVLPNAAALHDCLTIPRAACLLICEPFPGDWKDARELARLTLAAGVYYVGTNYWPQRLVWELSHNLTLERTIPEGSLMAHPDLLARSRVSEFVLEIVGSLQSLPEESTIHLEDELAFELSLPRGAVRAFDAGAALLDRLREPFNLFNEERRGASWTVDLQRKLRAVTAAEIPLTYAMPPAEPPPADRYLQVRSERPQIAVFIDQPRSGSILANEIFQPMPDDGAPGHLLTVVFSSPALDPPVQIDTFYLPRTGSSTEANFTIPKEGPIEARISVLFRNRVLQTALYDGSSLTVEMNVRPGMVGLDQQPVFDEAIVLNHTSDGVPRATAGGGAHFSTFSIEGLSATVSQIEARINNARWASPDMQSLDGAGAEAFLRYLAIKGSALFLEFSRYCPDPARLRAASSIQVVAREHAARLPVELFYDRTPPTPEASLCSQWRTALSTGTCSCGDSEDIICPLGFWCLSKVIEWHRFDLSHAESTGGRAFALSASPAGQGPQSLPPFQAAIMGYSENVDKVVAGTSAALTARLKKALGRTARKASGWKDLAAKVSTKPPDLLVLVPHTLTDDNDMPAMEIAGDNPLPSINLKREHVSSPNGQPHPLVLLFGCNTDNSGQPHESFVSRFCDHQAAIVVSSISKVLGRHAAPLAADFVEQLCALRKAGSTSVGEAMRNLRRRSLLEGPPVAMVLKVYGDADWRL